MYFPKRVECEYPSQVYGPEDMYEPDYGEMLDSKTYEDEDSEKKTSNQFQYAYYVHQHVYSDYGPPKYVNDPTGFMHVHEGVQYGDHQHGDYQGQGHAGHYHSEYQSEHQHGGYQHGGYQHGGYQHGGYQHGGHYVGQQPVGHYGRHGTGNRGGQHGKQNTGQGTWHLLKNVQKNPEKLMKTADSYAKEGAVNQLFKPVIIVLTDLLRIRRRDAQFQLLRI